MNLLKRLYYTLKQLFPTLTLTKIIDVHLKKQEYMFSFLNWNLEKLRKLPVKILKNSLKFENFVVDLFYLFNGCLVLGGFQINLEYPALFVKFRDKSPLSQISHLFLCFVRSWSTKLYIFSNFNCQLF